MVYLKHNKKKGRETQLDKYLRLSMYTHIYIYVYLYIYVYICTYRYLYVHKYMCVYISPLLRRRRNHVQNLLKTNSCISCSNKKGFIK